MATATVARDAPTQRGDPAARGSPTLPAWTLSREDRGGTAVVDGGASFIAAERPVDVRG